MNTRISPPSSSSSPARHLPHRYAVTACSELADYHWLTGDEARGLLDELAHDTVPLHTVVARLRGQVSPTRTHLLVEQVELRRRAAAKFRRPDCMFFTRRGLEQASDEWLARYKATRYASMQAVADLCCGIGGDLLGLTAQARAIGVDRDPVAAYFAAANAAADVRTADAAAFELESVNAWHIDPDRRPTGSRTTTLEFCQPNLDEIDSLLKRAANAAVKLAPATEVPAHWSDHCELEWISRARECRQLVAWHGELAYSPAQRRATVVHQNSPLHSGEVSGEGLFTCRTIFGLPNQPIPLTNRPDRYIFDIDAAVRAAKLQGHLAAEHNLCALATGPTYFTGPQPIDDDALACFEISDVLPLKTNHLARYLRERFIGRLEIKTRGLDIDPAKLRRDLKPRGDNEATLLITRVASRPAAIIARRYTP